MNVIDGLHKDFSDILTFLYKSGEISWRSVADENFRKVLLVAAASHFERSPLRKPPKKYTNSTLMRRLS